MKNNSFSSHVGGLLLSETQTWPIQDEGLKVIVGPGAGQWWWGGEVGAKGSLSLRG